MRPSGPRVGALVLLILIQVGAATYLVVVRPVRDLAVGVLGFAEAVIEDPHLFGHTTGLLPEGRAVAVAAHLEIAPRRSAPPRDGLDRWRSVRYEYQPTATGSRPVAAGTRGIVRIDPAIDEDDCDPGRPIAVLLTDGPHRGKVAAIPRRLLRKR